jgi:hypothetical protein
MPRNLFRPESDEPFRLSRSKIDLFLNCPKCFYLNLRLGVERPAGFPFSLNSAVDALLKKEFDIYRKKGIPHPLMEKHGIEAVPFDHPALNEWRDARRAGITYLHPGTNFNVTGGIDDVWISPRQELLIVDYKATAKNAEVALDADWQIGYKRQMEIYQWLFRKNNFQVSPVGYFVYVNGRADRETFDNKLEFIAKIIPYSGDDSWIDGTITAARKCLEGKELPLSSENCEYCRYAENYRRHH